MVIENISNVPAYNIRFIDFPDLIHYKNDGKEFINTKELGLINNGIEYMGPSQQYEVFFSIPDALRKDDNENGVKFNIGYFDVEHNEYFLKVDIMFKVLEDIPFDSTTKIVNAIEALGFQYSQPYC